MPKRVAQPDLLCPAFEPLLFWGYAPVNSVSSKRRALADPPAITSTVGIIIFYLRTSRRANATEPGRGVFGDGGKERAGEQRNIRILPMADG
jgi:hypothetical protein